MHGTNQLGVACCSHCELLTNEHNMSMQLSLHGRPRQCHNLSCGCSM